MASPRELTGNAPLSLYKMPQYSCNIHSLECEYKLWKLWILWIEKQMKWITISISRHKKPESIFCLPYRAFQMILIFFFISFSCLFFFHFARKNLYIYSFLYECFAKIAQQMENCREHKLWLGNVCAVNCEELHLAIEAIFIVVRAVSWTVF